MSASTLIGVDTSQIHDSSPMDTLLKRPARFVRELRAVLARKDTVSWQAFRPGFVRFWFHVSGQGGSYDLYLAQGGTAPGGQPNGSTLVCGHRLYRMDRELFEVLRRYVPEKDTYLPVPKRYR